MNAITIGSTGAVGRDLLTVLASDPAYERVDVLFSSLGTSKKQAGGKGQQWRVDHDYQLTAAKAARANGVPKMVVVSSVGADPASSFFYLRMKGEIESDLQALTFPSLTILRPPSLIRHPAKRLTETLSVKALQALNAVGLFKRMKPMPTLDVARAMAHLAQDEAQDEAQGMNIVSGQDILFHR